MGWRGPLTWRQLKAWQRWRRSEEKAAALANPYGDDVEPMDEAMKLRIKKARLRSMLGNPVVIRDAEGKVVNG